MAVRPTKRIPNVIDGDQYIDLYGGKDALTPLETALGLRGMVRWRLANHGRAGSGAPNPLPIIAATYGRRYLQFVDALPFVEEQVEIEKRRVRERAARYRAEPCNTPNESVKS